jgi:hypothetical protein
MTMQRYGSRLVFPHGSSKPSSMALPDTATFAPLLSPRKGRRQLLVFVEAAHAPQELLGYFPCTLFPLELIRYQPGRTGRRPTEPKESTNERDPVLRRRQPHPRP